jgi:hypothetical protein
MAMFDEQFFKDGSPANKFVVLETKCNPASRGFSYRAVLAWCQMLLATSLGSILLHIFAPLSHCLTPCPEASSTSLQRHAEVGVAFFWSRKDLGLTKVSTSVTLLALSKCCAAMRHQGKGLENRKLELLVRATP